MRGCCMLTSIFSATRGSGVGESKWRLRRETLRNRVSTTLINERTPELQSTTPHPLGRIFGQDLEEKESKSMRSKIRGMSASKNHYPTIDCSPLSINLHLESHSQTTLQITTSPNLPIWVFRQSFKILDRYHPRWNSLKFRMFLRASPHQIFHSTGARLETVIVPAAVLLSLHLCRYSKINTGQWDKCLGRRRFSLQTWMSTSEASWISWIHSLMVSLTLLNSAVLKRRALYISAARDAGNV